MNPETNMFEELTNVKDELNQANLDRIKGMFLEQTRLLRPNGEPVPISWTQFRIGEHVVIKNYTFKVAYIGETSILFEPVGVVDLSDGAG
jgi:hypothetical protein